MGYPKPLHWWTENVLPLVYDESLSYYEVMSKIVTYINGITQDTIQTKELVEEIKELVENAGYNTIPEILARLDELDATITSLNADNAQNKADIATLKTDNTQNKANITTLKTDNTQNKADIAELKTDNTQNKADINTLKTDNAQNKADIAELKTDNTHNKADITTLKTDNTQNKADIAELKTDNTQNKADIYDLKNALNETVLDRMELAQPVDWHDLESDTLGYVMQADGTVVEYASRFYSDFIPVKEGDTVYQFYYSGNSRFEQYRRGVCCFDADKQVITGGNNSSQIAGFSVPSGVSYVRITCDQSGRNNIVFTVNDIPTSRPAPFFEPHYIIKTDFLTDETKRKIDAGADFSKFACSLPKQALRMTIGIAEKWYFSNAGSPTYDFIEFGAGAENTLVDNNGVQFRNTTPLESGIYFRWKYYNSLLNIVDTQGGDAQYGHARHFIDENLSSCSCLVIGDSTVDHDTMTAKMLSYFTGAGKTLTLLGTLGSGGNYNEGRAGWKATDYLTNRSYEGTVNPFYNPATATFDFSYYMANQGYSAPDFVVLQLGINDLYYSYSDAIESTWSAIKAMIDSIISYNSAIKILLNLPTPPNTDQSKLSNDRFLYQNTIIRYARYAMDQAKTLYGETKVRPTYCHLILDPSTDIRDDIHPTTGGYEKMAMEVINQINCWQNGV